MKVSKSNAPTKILQQYTQNISATSSIHARILQKRHIIRELLTHIHTDIHTHLHIYTYDSTKIIPASTEVDRIRGRYSLKLMEFEVGGS